MLKYNPEGIVLSGIHCLIILLHTLIFSLLISYLFLPHTSASDRINVSGIGITLQN